MGKSSLVGRWVRQLETRLYDQPDPGHLEHQWPIGRPGQGSFWAELNSHILFMPCQFGPGVYFLGWMHPSHVVHRPNEREAPVGLGKLASKSRERNLDELSSYLYEHERQTLVVVMDDAQTSTHSTLEDLRLLLGLNLPSQPLRAGSDRG